MFLGSATLPFQVAEHQRPPHGVTVSPTSRAGLQCPEHFWDLLHARTHLIRNNNQISCDDQTRYEESLTGFTTRDLFALADLLVVRSFVSFLRNV